VLLIEASALKLGSKSGAAAVALVSLSIAGGIFVRERLFDAASPPAASAERLQCDQLLQSFNAYPLLYLGEEFDGFPLRRCTRRQTPEKYDQAGNVREPATDFVLFIYGSCTPPATGEGCASPIQVLSDPPCGPKIVEEAKDYTVNARGSDVIVKHDGSVRIETGGYNVTIYATASSGALDIASQTDTALRAVEALRGANALASPASPDVSLDGSLVAAGTLCQ
jgi:hypothetical protein